MPSIDPDPASHSPPTPLRSPTGPGRPPYSPDVVARVRALVEGEGLSQREAAARSGVGVDAVGRWARRFGWRRANVARGAGAACGAGAPRAVGFGDGAGAARRAGARLRPGAGPASETLAEAWDPHIRHAEERSKSASRSTRDRGASFATRPAAAPQDDDVGRVRSGLERRGPPRPRRYGPEVREAARARVEGTRDGLERIANELGLVRSTVLRWAKRSGWRRPAPPEKVGPGGTVGPMFYRSRRFGRPYGGDAVGTARDLVTGSILPLHRIAARAGVSRATLCRWIVTRGWTRPSAVARRRRYRPPYPPEVVAEALELYRTTMLPAALIAARVKATPERVWYWARTAGWTRPKDRPRRERIRKPSSFTLMSRLGA